MQPVPIAAVLAEFMEEYEPPIHSAKTCRMMRQAIREFVTEDAKLISSHDLAPAAVFRWMKRHPQRTAITTAAHLRNFRVLCNFAVGRGWLPASPFAFNRTIADAVKVRKESKARHHSLATIGRVLALLRERAARSWADHRLFALAATVAYTGARALEAQYAEVADFDLGEGFFAIRPKPEHPLKTKGSARDVPIPPELSRTLGEWLPEAGSRWAYPGARRLGPWVSGLNGTRPLDRLKQAGVEAGVSGFTFLSLRHSFVTHGNGPWGIGAKGVQQIAGHTLITTQEEYMGRDRDNLRAAVATISFPAPALAAG